MPPRLLTFVVFCLAVAGPSGAGAAPPSPRAVAAETAPVFPIRIGNRTIVTMRGSLLGYGAEERANAAERRLQNILERANSAPLKASTRATESGVAVELDGQTVFMITPDDVNTLLDETPALVAEEAALALGRAAAEAREEKQPRALLMGTAQLTVVTLVWLLVLKGLYHASRWVSARVSRHVMRRASDLGVTEVAELPLARIYLVCRRAVAVGAWVVALFATSTWLSLALDSFAWTRPFAEQVQGSLIGLLAMAASAIFNAFPGLLVVALIVVLTRFAVGLLRAVFARVERGDFENRVVNRYTANTTRRLLTGVLWLFALAMAYPYIPGAQTDAFKGLSVLAGVMVSLGASGVVSQIASGLIVLYAHALRPGHYIRVGESEGTIVEIGAFSTRLRTGLGEDVLVPNSVMLANTLTNFSLPSGRGGFALDASVTIGYDAPWREVQNMLVAAARRVEGVASSPAPYVIQTELADFYVAYRLVACSDESSPRQRMQVLSELHAAIQDVFNEHGVQIMSPHYAFDPRAPKVVPKERWQGMPGGGK